MTFVGAITSRVIAPPVVHVIGRTPTPLLTTNMVAGSSAVRCTPSPSLVAMAFEPHRPYERYKLPVFIIGADDRHVLLRSDLGDVKVTRLEEWDVSGKTLYACLDPDRLCLYGKPELWRIRTWNGKVSSISYADIKIYPLTANGWDDTIPLYFSHLDTLGIAASGLNTVSLNLWRTTLTHSISLREDQPLEKALGPIAIHTGGRKEAKRGTYRNRVDYDIIQAYPTALALPLPTMLTPAPESFVRRMDISKWEGIAVARVRIPPMEWGPLPIVIDLKSELTCYGYTRPDEWATVTLPLSELLLAESVGCEVELLKVSIGTKVREPFRDWFSTVVPALRSLPGTAGTIGKLTVNRLWSCFAVSPNGIRKEHTFDTHGRMVTVDVKPDTLSQIRRRASTAYVGAIVQSRVRQRLYREGLQHFSGVVYMDTDGVVAKRSKDVPDGWAIKNNMRWLDVAGPQALNYYCDLCLPPPVGHDGPHWTVAGATSVEAKSRLFRQIKEGAMTVTNIGNILPSMDVNDAKRLASNEHGGTSEALAFFDTA